jgi:hypothetical protein
MLGDRYPHRLHACADAWDRTRGWNSAAMTTSRWWMWSYRARRGRLGLRPGSAAHLKPRRVTRFQEMADDPAVVILGYFQ